MIFSVSRTSVWNDETPPCHSATKGTYLYKDKRTVDDPKKLLLNHECKNWYLKGLNHRIEEGCITRDLVKEGWLLEIKDLDELIEFTKAQECEVVYVFDGRFDTPHIEIYDDYRE